MESVTAGTATSRVAAWDKQRLGREALIDVALGDRPADVVILNGRVLSVNTGTVKQEGIAIRGDRIAALGDVEYTIGAETEVIDASGKILIPGLVSSHVHQWHSGQNGTVWAQCHLLAGTTSAADGFYGCGIVAGVKGIRFLVDEILRTPLKLIFLVPTYSYAQTRMLGFPVSPNAVSAEETLEMLDWPEALGLEETGYEHLLQRGEKRDRNMVRFLEKCVRLGKVATGHGPSLPSERELNAWIAAGISNNHEVMSLEEATRQSELGLQVVLREAPALHDLERAVRAVTERGYDGRAFQICPDLATAMSIFDGQLDVAVRKAIECGLDPIRAIQMATIQTAEYYGVSQDVGMIAPGRFADIVFLDDLVELAIGRVMVNGRILVEDGRLVENLEQPDYPPWLYETFDVPRRFSAQDLACTASCDHGQALVRVIGIDEDRLDSTEEHHWLEVRDGVIHPDPERGINKVAVIDRLHGRADYGVGFVRGFSLQAGAMGQTINFAQCIVVVAADDDELAAAVNAIIDRRGAYIAVRDGEVVAELPTPLLGLAADVDYDDARAGARAVSSAWRSLGCSMEAPMAWLEFVCGANMPTLRLTHLGLTEVRMNEARTAIDLESFGRVSLVEDLRPSQAGAACE